MMRIPATPLIAAAFVFLCISPVHAEWVATQGERLFGPELSETEACQIAERKAKDSALKNVTGEHLSSEDLMVCKEAGGDASCDLNQFTWSVIDGEIKGVRAKKVRTEAGVSGYRKCIVTMEVDVGIPKGQSDPGFDMGVILNASVYRDGDLLKVTIEPNTPMYVSIFQWLPYDNSPRQVGKIFPNPYDTQNQFTGPASVPTTKGGALYDLEVRFPTHVAAEKRLVDEYLMVVGTRTPVSFRNAYTLEEFNARLLEIPRAESRRVKRAYAVVRK